MLTSNQLIETLCERAGIDSNESDLKIQFGKNGRTLYGTMASGEQRNELTDDRTVLIAAVIAEAPTQGVDLADYAQKRPQLEIRSGEDVLFRQERDGMISVNELWQPELVTVLDDTWSTQIAARPMALPEPEVEPMTTPQAAAEVMVNVAKELIDPLSEATADPVVMIGDYTLATRENNLAVLLHDTPVAYAVGATAVALPDTTPAIAEGFSRWMETLLNRPDPSMITEFYRESVDLQLADIPAIDVPPALMVASQQIAQLPQSESKAFFHAVVADLTVHSQKAIQAVKEGLESETFQAVKQTVVEGAKTTFKAVQEELASERVQALKQQVQTSLQTGGTKALEVGGRGLEKAGQWLASRPDAIRTHQAAKAALETFTQGFERTQERQYEHHGFRVALEGRNTYRLSDAATGQDLLRFKAENVFYQKDPKITILEQPDKLSREQSQALALLRQDADSVRGSEQEEHHHAQKSEQFANAARSVAAYNEVSSYQDQHYAVQVGPNSLVVTAADGRGELYRQQDNQIDSRLAPQDFERASKAMQKLQEATQAQETKHDFELD